MSNLARYDELLTEASDLKFYGRSAVPSGGKAHEERWKRLVATHRAAQLELKALAQLDAPLPETEISHRMEAAGLFLDSHDPVSAFKEWSEIGRILNQHPDDTRLVAIIIPLDDRVRRASEQYQRLVRIYERNEKASDQIRLLRLRELQEQFPGVGYTWIWRYQLMSKRDKPAAKKALDRASELDPDGPGPAGFRMLHAIETLPQSTDDERAAVAEELRRELAPWRENSGLINFVFALSLLGLYRPTVIEWKLSADYVIEISNAIIRAKKLGLLPAWAPVIKIVDEIMDNVHLYTAEQIMPLFDKLTKFRQGLATAPATWPLQGQEGSGQISLRR